MFLLLTDRLAYNIFSNDLTFVKLLLENHLSFKFHFEQGSAPFLDVLYEENMN